ncbi:chromosome segregation protein ScpA [Paramagnetospirillum marisnigri]|uniref:Segregation and condensation protein A n=1 Tax=Paramagnetospirillum marisnigri TaxID=1285242 RepID=A0A178M5L0_9PROT|nr:ScpA family protein [Paramagnetospirillum marisnigri]OAN44049.1 chromosome segregation protein ScpA [Paramagnetospirillum marisnigri]
MQLDVFQADEERAGREPGERLILDLDGWEGPLDVLLQLARDQKVDLAKISILKLADQYIEFIDRVRQTQLDLAAEYLVMAAWLAYLKSRLLLPEPEPEAEDELSPEEMAAALAFRLKRLQGMRDAGAALFARRLLGRDVFGRGDPEDVEVVSRSIFDLALYDLLKTYADHVVRNSVRTLTVEAPDLWSVEDALARLESMLGLGRLPDWSVLMSFLPPVGGDALKIKSAMASTFVAALELTKQGRLTLRQDGAAYSPIYVKAGEGRGSLSDE